MGRIDPLSELLVGVPNFGPFFCLPRLLRSLPASIFPFFQRPQYQTAKQTRAAMGIVTARMTFTDIVGKRTKEKETKNNGV